jgi:hypothetical protein
VAGLAAALTTLGAARPAHAYCRTTTVGVPADYDPTEVGCWVQGYPLYWTNACVSYDLQKDASEQMSYDSAAAAIAQAFSQWTGTACPTDGSGPSRVSIDVRDFGPVDCGTVEYNQYGPNQHTIVFRDDTWPYHDSSNTLALTTVTFDPDTGEIYDADMEINSTMPLTAWDPANPYAPIAADGYDFLSIVTHETGHFLGMAHSADDHATMFAHYTPGATAMRLLTADDVAGICSIYSPDGTRNTSPQAVPPNGQVPEGACDATPRHGWTSSCCASEVGGQCQPPPAVSCDVSNGAGAPQQGRPGWLALGALSLALVGVRARARARARRA